MLVEAFSFKGESLFFPPKSGIVEIVVKEYFEDENGKRAVREKVEKFQVRVEYGTDGIIARVVYNITPIGDSNIENFKKILKTIFGTKAKIIS